MSDISKVKLPGNDTTYYVKDARIAYGTCSTAAATVDKVVSATSFILVSGARIAVKFTVTNTASNPTLNVNSTGAKAIYYRGAAISAGQLAANRIHEFVYNGTQYELIGDLDSNSDTYPTAYCTTAETTAAKVATCTNYALLSKSYTHILITKSNTAQSALTLNINSKGAKPIYINGSASSSSNYTLPAGTYLIYYDGTNYYFRTDGKIQGVAPDNHTHPISIVADSGTNQLTLAASTKYKLTAGGNSYIFTTPPNTEDTHYTTHVYAGSGSAANAATTNGNTKLTIADNTTVPSTNGYVTIKGTGATTVTSDANGVITINSTDNNSNTIPSAYCDTASSTAAKVASCTNYALLSKSYTHILITKSNTAQNNLTLSINDKTAKPIYINGEASSSSNFTLPAGTYLVYYDGTNYYFRTDGVLAKTSYTPAGSVTVTPSVTAPTTTVNSITAVGTLPSCTFPTYTLPSCTLPTYSVADEVLEITAGSFNAGSWTAGSFSAGTLPTKGANTTVVKSVSVTATGSFDGTPATISVKGN